MNFADRLKNAWNVFRSEDRVEETFSYGSSYQTYRNLGSRSIDRSIINTIINRIATDVASIDIRHVRLDTEDRYIETINDSLNNCLQLEANIDQSARAFVQDIVASLLDEGVIAVVPIYTDVDPKYTDSYKILAMRVAKIVQWYPNYVRIDIYDDKTGNHRQTNVRKDFVAIIENPFYSIMNEPNSTIKRLSRKLNLLDSVDEQSTSGKLDMIIQLPYSIKTESKRRQADERRKEIERQLTGSKYGIAYTDGTEKITQLNRPLENNLLATIEFLTKQAQAEIGITQAILDGSADEKTMLNYYNRIVEPIISTIVKEFKRKFLTKTARSQGHSIEFFRDPFKLVPVSQLAEIADKFTRNEIMTSNEIRQIIGRRPSDDPNADQLRNKNLNQNPGMDPAYDPNYEEDPNADPNEEYYDEGGYENQNEAY